MAEELIRRADTFITRRDSELSEKRVALGVSDDVASIETLTPAMLVALGEKGVKTLDDLADLASDELIEIVGAEAMDEATANDVIMAARAHWFEARGEPGGRSKRPNRPPRRPATTEQAVIDPAQDEERARNRAAPPLHPDARAAAEGTHDPVRRRAGPRDRA